MMEQYSKETLEFEPNVRNSDLAEQYTRHFRESELNRNDDEFEDLAIPEERQPSVLGDPSKYDSIRVNLDVKNQT